MKLTAGPVTVRNTKPPCRAWDGNQATYLFFPVFTSFVLALLSSLSVPIIPGLSMVDVTSEGSGTVSFGTWGWCLAGAANVDNTCSAHRAFAGSLDLSTLSTVQPGSTAFRALQSALPQAYLNANAVFHVFACTATWMTTTWTLAASGAWSKEEQYAYQWTRWAFAGTFWSSLFLLIAWALDLGMVTRMSSGAITRAGTQPSVTPGPAIWLMMTAFLLNLATFIVRIAYLKYQPRPTWTISGQASSDLHDPARPPLTLDREKDEQPPTWESLNLNTPAAAASYAIDEKPALEPLPDVPSVEQAGFAV